MPMSEITGFPDVDSVETRLAELGLPTYTQAVGQMRYLIDHMPGAFAVLLGDSDGLKDVNDGAGGHLAGDQLIVETGKALASQTTASGFVTLGRQRSRRRNNVAGLHYPTANHRKGDEFIVVLPGLRTQTEVDTWIEATQMDLASQGIRLTLSGRVHTPGEGLSALLTSVDRLLKFDKGFRSVDGKTPEQLEAARKIGELAAANGLSLREIPKIIGFLPFIAYEFDSSRTDRASSDPAQTAAASFADLS